MNLTDLEKEGAEVKNTMPPPEGLQRLLNLAFEYETAQKSIAKKKKELAEAEERFKTLTTKTLPSVLQEYGINDIGLTDGARIEIEKKTYASLKKDSKHREAAFKWLEANQCGGLIKKFISVQLERGVDSKPVEEALAKLGLECEVEESVHYQTLVAWVRERRAKSLETPWELFGAYFEDVAVITPATI